jgi:hypothetical protein
MQQNEDVSAFVDEHLQLGSAVVKAPMPDKHEMYADTTPLDEAGAKKFRSMLMSLSWFAQQTRLDIVTPVNMLAQLSAAPTKAAMSALHRVVRCLSQRRDFSIFAVRSKARSVDRNQWKFYVDSDLAGDPGHTRSRTGAVATLNIMPIYWRSNKQPMPCFSSGAAEVCAFSEAARDARSLVWRAEELGAKFNYPIKIHEDNSAAVAFQQSTSPVSKLKGIYNFRHNWIQELKDKMKLQAVKIDTTKNAADLFTKCHQHSTMIKLLNIINCGKEPSLVFRGC